MSCATASVYLRRFFLHNAYADVDLPLLLTTVLFVASKVDERPLHIKSLLSDAHAFFSDPKTLDWSTLAPPVFKPSEADIYEMEFYLLEDLDFSMLVFHPYRPLIALSNLLNTQTVCPATSDKVLLDDQAFQLAWWILNDSLRSQVALLYPPYLIALAALLIVLVLHPATASVLQPALDQPPPPPRPSLASLDFKSEDLPERVLQTLASLKVNLAIVAEIVGEIVSLYALWHHLDQRTSLDRELVSLLRQMQTARLAQPDPATSVPFVLNTRSIPSPPKSTSSKKRRPNTSVS